LTAKSINSSWLSKFYELAVTFAEKAELDTTSLRIEKAQLFELQAKNTPTMVKRERLKKVLSEYDKANQKEASERLKKEIQDLGHPQFTEIETEPIDIKKYVDETIKRISGKNFQESIVELCLLFPRIPRKEEVFLCVKEKMKSSISMMIPISIFDRDSRVVYEYFLEEERREYFAIEYATKYRYGLCYYTTISPALDVINCDHNFSLNDISELVKDSPFIPKGYKNTFAKGIYYFLQGKIIEASHLLILQIEECLRNLLNQYETTNIVNEDGSEEFATNIASLLKKCVEQKIFSVDLAWILEIYLISKPINLRAYIAHGRIGDDVLGDC
jgi:hypothetical protein